MSMERLHSFKAAWEDSFFSLHSRAAGIKILNQLVGLLLAVATAKWRLACSLAQRVGPSW